MSAGTILCMSGDKIFMDYSSSLGPIDPQIIRQGMYVPALGYLDKVNELIEKSQNNAITPAEIAHLISQDLSILRLCEQARDLSVSLLKEWLATYKFKNWTKHRTNNPGTIVTDAEKSQRAQEIATLLADNKKWHMHGRFIGMETLKKDLKLEIDDFSTFGGNPTLSQHIRIYNDMLCEHHARRGTEFALYNRHVLQ